MYKIYQVSSNDTVSSIANNFNISSEELLKINGISSITPGQLIVVPSSESNFSIYVVKSGDNLYEIADKYNIDFNSLLAINGLNKDDYIYPNQKILIPKEDTLVYVTKEDDTINSVIKFLDISYENFFKNNQSVFLKENQLIIYKTQ